ncbi:MAG: hypothetical protein BWY70_00022 [Bacteroidetes bacterium ADurb.Bin408]|nr:MAG: hypothetical protein BWY70_00022 [Bacteroidetes bacterium ADurb.Bin408]
MILRLNYSFKTKNMINLKKALFLLALIPAMVNAQENVDKPAFGIKFTGFVKNDVFFDTRQTVDIREGHFLLYPQNVKNDINQKDINATPNFNMLAIQSRLTGNITGPDAFKAKTSGIIEGEFFGHSDADINGFRLRHAYVKLNWNDKTELIAGQTWNPLFIVQAFPEVISFNTGVPFVPFARNPQLRVSHKLGKLNVSATAYAERDFASNGPKGASNIYMRNAAVPGSNVLVSYACGSNNIFGVGGDYKMIVPEIETTKGYVSRNSLGSLTATAFSKIKIKNTTWKLQATFAQNAHDLTMLGGYAIKNTGYDTLTDIKEYTNYQTGSIWTELYTVMGKYTCGVFGGFTKNFGTDYNILPQSTIYARGSNIAYVYRVSPRFMVTQEKTTIGLEVEYTTAAYGKANSLGEVENAKEVSNIRGLLSFIYKF